MKIHVLLPFKEQFDINKASSVSITVRNNFKYSTFKKNIRIYGRLVENPIIKNSFIGIKLPFFHMGSKNKFLAKKMCEHISKQPNDKHIIEIHNRPYLLNVIKKHSFNHPISLFFHNDPQTMKGSSSIIEREKILSICHSIFCVSNYIKKQFLEGISHNSNRVHVLYNGVDRQIKKNPAKKNKVLFVGRLTPEKGVDMFVDATRKVANIFLNWDFEIVGSKRLGQDTYNDNFVDSVITDFKSIGKQAIYNGFINYDSVQKKMQEASIVVIPSKWKEPFGLVAAEAMSNGSAIIASNEGGIPEIIGNNGILINNINSQKIECALIKLMSNRLLLEEYQFKSWKNFSLSSNISSNRLDFFRGKIIFSHYEYSNLK